MMASPTKEAPMESSPSTARLIDGKAAAAELRAELAAKVAAFPAGRRPPCLAVVQVGEDPASSIYVRNKKKACAEAGFRSVSHELADATPEADLLALVAALNADPEVDGILVQLPLPKHMDEARVLLTIDPAKDVDGFHPVNVGKLLLGQPTLPSCTPAGVMELLRRHDVPLRGAHAVVVGRSAIVGKPVAALLLNADATVTICHSRTKDLAAMTRQADVIVAAVGRAGIVTGDMVKPGAVVIDVGINRTPEGKVVGDVDFASVAAVAGMITPVPGGVGPMTIAMLLANTLAAYERRMGA
jgi:methylenetetrahydrofolate dehydrogenase (NADP+)/methenyltetrahydrofolate cyclohydrolase